MYNTVNQNNSVVINSYLNFLPDYYTPKNTLRTRHYPCTHSFKKVGMEYKIIKRWVKLVEIFLWVFTHHIPVFVENYYQGIESLSQTLIF